MNWVQSHSDHEFNIHASLDLHTDNACNDLDLLTWHLFNLYDKGSVFYCKVDNVKCLDPIPFTNKSMFHFIYST